MNLCCTVCYSMLKKSRLNSYSFQYSLRVSFVSYTNDESTCVKAAPKVTPRVKRIHTRPRVYSSYFSRTELLRKTHYMENDPRDTAVEHMYPRIKTWNPCAYASFRLVSLWTQAEGNWGRKPGRKGGGWCTEGGKNRGHEPGFPRWREARKCAILNLQSQKAQRGGSQQK